MSREDLHSEANLTGVLQRAEKQLLKYMFDEAQHGVNLVIPVRETRTSTRINFKQDRLVNKKYEKPPYCRGKVLWDALEDDTQHMDNKFEFTRKISRNYMKYVKDYPS